jgi:hypothetical protein
MQSWCLSQLIDTDTSSQSGRGKNTQIADVQLWGPTETKTLGGAHQQTSERAAPPVSVEEKGKATGDKIKMLLFLLMSIQY